MPARLRPNPRLHYAVWLLYMRARRLPRGIKQLSETSGTGTSTLYSWFSDARPPRVHDLERCLNAVGYTLKAVRME